MAIDRAPTPLYRGYRPPLLSTREDPLGQLGVIEMHCDHCGKDARYLVNSIDGPASPGGRVPTERELDAALLARGWREGMHRNCHSDMIDFPEDKG